MSIKTFFRDLLTGENKIVDEKLWIAWAESKQEYSARELAFSTAVKKIADALAKSEIKTISAREEEQGLDWYRFNYAPNKHDDGGTWIRMIVRKLCEDNECLILDVDDDLIIADSFEVKKTAKFPWTFSNVVSEDFKFNKQFQQHRDCIYLRFHSDDIKNILNSVYESFAEMMSIARDLIANSGGTKAVVSMAGMAAGDSKEKEVASEIMNNRIRPLWENRHAVVPLPQGFSFQDLNKDKKWESTRDYRAMIDDIYDLTGAAFGISPIVLKGQQTTSGGGQSYEAAYNAFLTDAVGSPKEIFETAFTRYLYSREEIFNGSRVEIDTSTIKHFDLFDKAGAIEKLVGSGAFKVDEVRRRANYQATDDPIGKQHLVTKNFGTAEDITGQRLEESEGSGDGS